MYRGRRRVCPGCGAPMDEVPVEGDDRGGARAEIDRCARCGGIFLEFFDGEPTALSRGLEGRHDLDAAVGGSHGGAPTCPDCGTEMVLRAYLGHGPEVPRCETCLAVFLTPALREALAEMTLPPEEPAAEPSWIARAIEWVRGR